MTITGSSSITISATPVQLVDSDPLTDYLATAAAATTTTLVTGSLGKLITAQLSTGFGSHVQLAINATQQIGGTAMSCTISVFVILKDQTDAAMLGHCFVASITWFGRGDP